MSKGLVLMIAAVACAPALTPQQKAALETDAARTVTCDGKDDCEIKWAAALRWVSDNSHWKLRAVTESLVTTEGPFDTVYAAFQVQKFPLGGGRYEFQFSAGCGNMFGCAPSVLELTASFKNTVAASGPPIFVAARPPAHAWSTGSAAAYRTKCDAELTAGLGTTRSPQELRYACECFAWGLQDRYTLDEAASAAKSKTAEYADFVKGVLAECKRNRPASLGPDLDDRGATSAR
jgi:hypothetical protein